MARDSQVREADGETSLIDRRSWLKVMGLSAAPIAGVASDAARAATESGYGESGYGDGGYGGTSSESTLAVTTGTATDVTDSSITLDGEVSDLGGASSVDVGFEIRKSSATTWSTTSVQTLSATGTFSTTLDGLSSTTNYEYRAVAAASDGDTATGSIQTFTTENPLAVSTGSATDVTDSSVTLDGEVSDLGGASSVDVGFEIRKSTATTWSTTNVQTLSAAGNFTTTLDGLSNGTSYEYRAVATASDGDTATGSIETVTTENPLTVGTGDATDVTDSTATLHGEVTDLGSASSVEVGFEVRDVGTTTWTTTSTQTLSATGTFTTTLDSLGSGTEYEYRVTVTASDGDTATGSPRTFTTQSANHSPTIEQFTVSESGSPNPHAEISVSWSVSDADADLQTVEVTVADASGQVVKSADNSASGQSATGSESFKIKHGGGTSYECKLTVTDADSQTTSQTKSVTA